MPDATIDLHLHLPAGAQKKDGPSAGVAMVRRSSRHGEWRFGTDQGGLGDRSVRLYPS
jgi:hypothetical protein